MVPSPFACARGAASPLSKFKIRDMLRIRLLLFLVFLIVHFTLLLKDLNQSPNTFYVLVAIEIAIVSSLVIACDINEEGK